ncbi:protein of unknown function [Acidithiobacillus ferrivorans]|uniref:Uncharacterized protein n=1 Tax=Acidithiobacillus ferrivorans TaxID=160808 RepID=A0A060UMB0_9PROT|nr:hypothetical protein AFERRI_30236 [Acidithiobacillus ferrivorans]SMH67165.1 protein of unknown function [Acidithiobacillus ferrivorans]
MQYTCPFSDSRWLNDVHLRCYLTPIAIKPEHSTLEGSTFKKKRQLDGLAQGTQRLMTLPSLLLFLSRLVTALWTRSPLACAVA